jgi:hypothetical protein
MITAFFPSLLLFFVEKRYTPKAIVGLVILITFVSFLLTFANRHLGKVSEIKVIENSKRYDLMFTEKVISMDYELIEGPLAGKITLNGVDIKEYIYGGCLVQ